MSPRLLLLAVALSWHSVRPGIWMSEGRWANSGPLASVRVVVVRMDPRQLQFRLDSAARDYGLKAAWTIDRIPDDGLVAFNTGQFIGGIPWGWVVQDGYERKEPGTGALGMSFVVDSAGTTSLVTPEELSKVRGRVRYAFQSYPTLLVGGEMPSELQASGRGVNLAHRDSRLALGVLKDGSIVIALTRFGAAGRAGETLPWGPTTPEMAAFMRSLGCVRAMMLDGGISSQLALRGSEGSVRRWSNWRSVPLAVVVKARETPASTRLR